MRAPPFRISALVVAIASGAIVGCEEDSIINEVAVNPVVTARDQCDSASFNAALGPGTCVKAGSVTFAQFNDELNATQRVAAWNFDPSTITVRVGQRINAVNVGGEEHTFTEVESFGGGIVPALNTASGNLTAAPECLQLSSSDRIAPGGTFTTDEASTVGTEHYQCCIHPWMRATVSVVP